MTSQSLQSLITDYSNSLTRIDAEKDLMARIAQEADLHHKDKAKDTRDDLQEQVDLFDQLINNHYKFASGKSSARFSIN